MNWLKMATLVNILPTLILAALFACSDTVLAETTCFINDLLDTASCPGPCCAGRCCENGESPPPPGTSTICWDHNTDYYLYCPTGCCEKGTQNERCCTQEESPFNRMQNWTLTPKPDSTLCFNNSKYPADFIYCEHGCCGETGGQCCREGETPPSPKPIEDKCYHGCTHGCCGTTMRVRCCVPGEYGTTTRRQLTTRKSDVTTQHPDSTFCYINEVHDYRHCPLGCCVGRCCNESDILHPGETICYIEAEQSYRYCGYGCCNGKCCSHPSSTMCWMNNIHDYKYCPMGCCGDECCRDGSTQHSDSTLCFDDKKEDYVYCSHGCCGGKCCDLIYQQKQGHQISAASIAFIVLGTICTLVIVVGLVVYVISRQRGLPGTPNIIKTVHSVPEQNAYVYHEPYQKI
ncbi:keratin-associated protein 9-1-like isoform X2 [Saccostrea echinata]|uniref:keratin-associated protein 9-1-like isoform X2 n=1 Tax=Saccostrea echinata TaxID=191078 RepID=UPI002A82BBFA|nr:keratin-associated protein 9-1-like isoform X2 [Saccostrea echinata]